MKWNIKKINSYVQKIIRVAGNEKNNVGRKKFPFVVTEIMDDFTKTCDGMITVYSGLVEFEFDHPFIYKRIIF